MATLLRIATAGSVDDGKSTLIGRLLFDSKAVMEDQLAAVERTSIGVTHGLFGPKLQPGGGGFRPFVTLKGGFVDFRLSPSLLPYSDVASAVFGLRTSNLNAAMYPAAGIEATLGPVGLRLEAGDEIYFNQGAHNNLRITFGPILRF